MWRKKSTLAATTGGGNKAGEAWEKHINANGGVAGHKVKLVVKDIAGKTGAGLAAAKQLIQDKVVAIIDQDAASDSTWIKTAAEAKIPVLVGVPGIGAYVSPDAFPYLIGQAGGVYGLMHAAKSAGSIAGAVYPTELSAAVPVPLYQAMAKANGVELPVITSVSSASPDFTAVCQQLKNAKVNSYTVAGHEQFTAKVVDQCRKQGLTVPQTLIGAAATEDWKTNPAYQNAMAVGITAPIFDDSNEALNTYRDALKKYVPDFVGKTADNGIALGAWLGGQLIVAAAAHVDGDLTGASLQQGLYALKDETLGGLVQPLNYVAGQITSLNCFFEFKSADGAFTAVNDAKPICGPAEVLKAADAAIIKAMAK
mgnify:CR=1 FL=1